LIYTITRLLGNNTITHKSQTKIIVNIVLQIDNI